MSGELPLAAFPTGDFLIAVKLSADPNAPHAKGKAPEAKRLVGFRIAG